MEISKKIIASSMVIALLGFVCPANRDSIHFLEKCDRNMIFPSGKYCIYCKNGPCQTCILCEIPYQIPPPPIDGKTWAEYVTDCGPCLNKEYERQYEEQSMTYESHFTQLVNFLKFVFCDVCKRLSIDLFPIAWYLH